MGPSKDDWTVAVTCRVSGLTCSDEPSGATSLIEDSDENATRVEYPAVIRVVRQAPLASRTSTIWDWASPGSSAAIIRPDGEIATSPGERTPSMGIARCAPGAQVTAAMASAATMACPSPLTDKWVTAPRG